ncbi:MAG: hypothetical protein II857_06930 [Selenomonadaceae bacterium]|nr:hypothetical protein [Selenomonadaceae bacterium]
MAEIYNNKSNTLLSGTSTYDNIKNGGYDRSYVWHTGGSNVTILSGGGNSSIENRGSKVTISGGNGADTVYNGSYATNSSISGGGGNDDIDNYGSLVIINGGLGDDYISSGYGSNASNVTISGSAGADTISNHSGGANSSISGGSGNDYIYNSGNSVTIDGGAGDDSIVNGYDSNGSNVTISGGTGNDTICNNCYRIYDGSIYYGDRDDASNVLFKYNFGDGKDVIYGFKADSTLSIGGGSYSTEKDGNDIIVKVGDGEILLIGAADLDTLNIVGKEISANFWTLDGTTAKYGDLITVKGVKSLDGISSSGTTVTISKASLGTSKVSISDGYKLKIGSDVTTPETTNAWSLKKSKATYKQTATAGYILTDNAITYSKKSTKTLATVTGVKSLDGLSADGKVITVSKASLGTSKVSISGGGYKLKLGSDVTTPKTTKAWSFKNSTATYKQTTSAGYKLTNNAITYTKKSAKNLATIKGVKSTDGISVSGKRITLKNAALNKKVTVSGGYNFDFAADYKNATITGSINSDTIIARGKNILVNGGAGDDTIKILGTGTVKGGDGADIFYYKSSGANVISDYAAEDKISIATGTAATSTSGDDLVLTVGGKGKITVVGGKSKTVTYIDADGEHTYKDTSDGVKFNGKGVTLTADYSEDVFDLTDYPDYKDKIVTINASKVKHSLEITGNAKANTITGTLEDDSIDGGEGADLIKGGAGNDSLWGNKGSDTLYGGAGDDTFIYKNVDGFDVIADFEIGDKIQVIALDICSPTAENGDVTFAIGNSKLVIKGGADKFIQLYGANGEALAQKYTPRGV